MNFGLALSDSHEAQIVAAICVTTKPCTLGLKCGMACSSSAEKLAVLDASCSRACSRGVSLLSAAAWCATKKSESASFFNGTQIAAKICAAYESESASVTHQCVTHTSAPSFPRNASWASPFPSWSCMLRKKLICTTLFICHGGTYFVSYYLAYYLALYCSYSWGRDLSSLPSWGGAAVHILSKNGILLCFCCYLFKNDKISNSLSPQS